MLIELDAQRTIPVVSTASTRSNDRRWVLRSLLLSFGSPNMTHQESQREVTQHEAVLMEAKSAVHSARADEAAALDALREATTPEQAGILEATVSARRSGLALAEVALRRATEGHAEARERAARLAPHGDTLAKLDKAVSAIAKQDAMLSALAVTLHDQAAAEVRELRKLIEAAWVLYTSLPVDVRTRDLSQPQAAAPTFGAADPDATRLLALLSDSLLRRYGERVPTR